jgi:hypothetical protein
MENWSIAVWATGCQSILYAPNKGIPTDFDGLRLHLLALAHNVRESALH